MVTVNMAETVMQFIAQRLLAGAGRFKALKTAFSFHWLITVQYCAVRSVYKVTMPR